MTEPIFDSTTEQFWERLPSTYKQQDALQNWQFKRYISGIAGQENDVDSLLERFSYVSPEDGPGYRTADLVDPNTADAAWLPWLSQLVGVRFQPGETIPDQRADIINALGGTKAGTKAAMIQAAQKVLVGTKNVQLYDHTISAIGDGGEWDMLIITATTETLTNDMTPAAATMSSNVAWQSKSFRENVFTGSWTTTGMTASTGTTNPLVGNSYSTFSGAGNTYMEAVAEAGVTYGAKVAVRCDDGVATTATIELVFMNGSTQLSAVTMTNNTGLNSTWKWASGTGTAPATTTAVRVRITRASAGILLVTAPIAARGSAVPLYFNGASATLYPGVVTVDGVLTQPVVNYARNATFQINGGWNATNGVLSLTTARFNIGNSAAQFKITANGNAAVQPNADMPAYEGEPVHAYVFAESVQPGVSGFVSLTFTKADGTTSTVAGATATIPPTGFTQFAVDATAPTNSKLVRANFNVISPVSGAVYFVDNFMLGRGEPDLTYFDGTFQGCAYTDPANIQNSLSIGRYDTAQFIASNDAVSTSNYLEMTAQEDGNMLTETQDNITVTAGDPFTHMVCVQSMQGAGDPYTALFIVTYHNSSDVETGRFYVAGTFGMEITQLVVQATTPATTTHAKYHLYMLGVNVGDGMLISQAGSRESWISTLWVPEDADPVAAVIAAGQKPAGVLLHTTTFSTDWNTVESVDPTFDDWDGGTWTDIEQAGL